MISKERLNAIFEEKLEKHFEIAAIGGLTLVIIAIFGWPFFIVAEEVSKVPLREFLMLFPAMIIIFSVFYIIGFVVVRVGNINVGGNKE